MGWREMVECARIILLLPGRCLSNTSMGGGLFYSHGVSNRKAKVTFCAYLDAELLQTAG